MREAAHILMNCGPQNSLEGALRSFEREIQTQNFNSYDINEVLIQT